MSLTTTQPTVEVPVVASDSSKQPVLTGTVEMPPEALSLLEQVEDTTLPGGTGTVLQPVEAEIQVPQSLPVIITPGVPAGNTVVANAVPRQEVAMGTLVTPTDKHADHPDSQSTEPSPLKEIPGVQSDNGPENSGGIDHGDDDADDPSVLEFLTPDIQDSSTAEDSASGEVSLGGERNLLARAARSTFGVTKQEEDELNADTEAHEKALQELLSSLDGADQQCDTSQLHDPENAMINSRGLVLQDVFNLNPSQTDLNIVCGDVTSNNHLQYLVLNSSPNVSSTL